jgi:atlastin
VSIKNKTIKMSLPGEPKNIVKFVNSQIQFDKSALEALLLHSDVKNRKIVFVSIVGAFRRGKSFFLDYCLRYLYANVSVN